MLVELFPEAKFVHIHRNPFDIFRSHRHTLHTAGPYWQLQRTNYNDDDAVNTQIIEVVKSLYQGYFQQRSSIPPGRLYQIAYSDLERDPVGQLRGIYEALDLPEFQQVEERVRSYVASLADYKKNSFTELAADLRSRVYREWRPYFDEWGYAA